MVALTKFSHNIHDHVFKQDRKTNVFPCLDVFIVSKSH